MLRNRPTNSNDEDTLASRWVQKRSIVNALNYLNFSGGTISVLLTHKRFQKQVRIQAKPQPCTIEHLDGCWISLPFHPEKIQDYIFSHLLIDNGKVCISVKSEACSLSSNGFCLLLPEEGEEINARRKKRHSCIDIKAELTQNCTSFGCQATDFSSESISLRISKSSNEIGRLQTNYDSYLKLFSDNSVILASHCRISRIVPEEKETRLVVDLSKGDFHIFSPKKIRSVRQKLFPSPDIKFLHPLTEQKCLLKVKDISGVGFSVEDDEDCSNLLPGMVIPKLNIYFSNSHYISCRAQILYSKPTGHPGRQKLGFAIIEMPLRDHSQLISILKKVENPNIYINTKVDPDSLIKFFFETGFIYPEKYLALSKNREEASKTWKIIYEENQTICRHFVYRENNAIIAHIAMLRYFERTWLIHHHAAQHTSLRSSGLLVLEQLCHSIVDSRALLYSSMTYLTCFFREENRFPNLVFAGFAKHHGSRHECSLDHFYYIEACPPPDHNCSLERPTDNHRYILTESTQDDIEELSFFYNKESDGLLIKAFQLDTHGGEFSTIVQEYKDNGLTRSRAIYSIKMEGNTIGVVIFNNSNIGINLANLTNSAMVFLYSEDLDIKSLIASCELTMKNLGYRDLIYLFFEKNFPTEQLQTTFRKYLLFAINTQQSDPFIKFISKFCKLSRGG